MATLQHEIEIKVPIEKVWNILIDLKEVGKYNSYVKSVKCLSEQKGVGASRECQLEQGFAKERITVMDDLNSISMEMYESDFPLKYMKWTYYLSFKNGVTSLKTVSEYKVKYGFLGIILNQAVMKSKFDKTMKEVFDSLKNYGETKK